MEFDPKQGIVLSEKGWEMEGLLSGQPGQIHGPTVFLKLFYENPAEEKINEDVIKEFLRRYPEKGRYTAVRKPAIYSEFWSFRGHYGPGHANIRVVSISTYMVEAFRELDRLHELDEYFSPQWQRQIREDFRWKRYCTERGTHDNIPVYTDMGFLVARRDLARVFADNLPTAGAKLPESVFETREGGEIDFKAAISWAAVADLAHLDQKLFHIGSDRGTFYAYSLPYLYDLSDFMACFFEVLWSLGGDVYHFPVLAPSNTKSRVTFYKEQILLNKAIWRKFLSILPNAVERFKEVYDQRELLKRLTPLIEFFASKGVPFDRRAFGTDEGIATEKGLTALALAVRKCVDARLEIDDDDVITIDNRFAKDALTFLYDLVFDSNGNIPNPHDGDFSHEALFCRKWYSQIEDLRLRVTGPNPAQRKYAQSPITVRALPYFEQDHGDERRRRSCTTETVWCLALIKEALSPEIGWIFIDTIASREWVERRAQSKRGLPHRFDELKLMEHHDPEVYKLVQEIILNKQKKEGVYEARAQLVDPNVRASDVERRAQALIKAECNDRDLGDVLKAIRRMPSSSLEASDPAVKECWAKWTKEFGAQLSRESATGRVSELSDFERLQLRSKIPASRPFFHWVESILHEEIARLFSPQGRRYWYRTLTGVSDIDLEDRQVDKVLRLWRDEEKAGRCAFIQKVLDQIHERFIFELLTAVHAEVRRLWPAEKSGG
jgi:hypothetical protein